MEDEKVAGITSATTYIVTVIDTRGSGKISANINRDGKICIQLQFGRIKLRTCDDHLTGSFSSSKRDLIDARGRYRSWRTASFGEIVIPDQDEQVRICIDGVPYEILVAHVNFDEARTTHVDTSSQKKQKIRSSSDVCISMTHMYKCDHTDMIEKFDPHTCTSDCMRGCPGGVWTQ